MICHVQQKTIVNGNSTQKMIYLTSHEKVTITAEKTSEKNGHDNSNDDALTFFPVIWQKPTVFSCFFRPF